MKIIYTDNNATTRVAPEVLEEMLPYFSEQYGNPSSMHSFGGNVGKKLQEARERVAQLINADPSEIVFTSCGTESDNAAIMAALELNPDRKHIITSAVEHPAVRNLCKYLEEKKGYKITFVPVDSKGRLNTELLYNSMTDYTAIISLMWANNETGVIFPVEEVAQKAAEKGILFHTDAVQAAGKIPIDVKNVSVKKIDVKKIDVKKIDVKKNGSQKDGSQKDGCQKHGW